MLTHKGKEGKHQRWASLTTAFTKKGQILWSEATGEAPDFFLLFFFFLTHNIELSTASKVRNPAKCQDVPFRPMGSPVQRTSHDGPKASSRSEVRARSLKLVWNCTAQWILLSYKIRSISQAPRKSQVHERSHFHGLKNKQKNPLKYFAWQTLTHMTFDAFQKCKLQIK